MKVYHTQNDAIVLKPPRKKGKIYTSESFVNSPQKLFVLPKEDY